MIVCGVLRGTWGVGGGAGGGGGGAGLAVGAGARHGNAFDRFECVLARLVPCETASEERKSDLIDFKM